MMKGNSMGMEEGMVGGLAGFARGEMTDRSRLIDRQYDAGCAEIAAMLEDAWARGDREAVLNVEGVGLGFKRVKRRSTSDLSLQVFVKTKHREPGACKMPRFAGGLRTDVIEQGEAWVSLGGPPKNHNSPSWPEIAGTSIGLDTSSRHGTAGCVVIDERGRKYVLTCNHVVARGANPQVGDWVSQAGPGSTHYDARKALMFGRVAGYVPIKHSQRVHAGATHIPASSVNTVDVALIEIVEQEGLLGEVQRRLKQPVSPEIKGIGGPRGPCPFSHEIRLDTPVCKAGATTGVRYAKIASVNKSDWVYSKRDGVARSAYHQGLVGVYLKERWYSSRFAGAGDSGSLVVEVGTKRPIGILMARATKSRMAFVCPIGEYLAVNRLQLWTGA
jgi:hypothetical protein